MTMPPLERLLTILADGQAHTLVDLAQGSGVTPDLLEQMLRDLERAGYLQTVESICGERCEHCSVQGACALSHAGRIWSVTDKGFRLAGQA